MLNKKEVYYVYKRNKYNSYDVECLIKFRIKIIKDI